MSEQVTRLMEALGPWAIGDASDAEGARILREALDAARREGAESAPPAADVAGPVADLRPASARERDSNTLRRVADAIDPSIGNREELLERVVGLVAERDEARAECERMRERLTEAAKAWDTVDDLASVILGDKPGRYRQGAETELQAACVALYAALNAPDSADIPPAAGVARGARTLAQRDLVRAIWPYAGSALAEAVEYEFNRLATREGQLVDECDRLQAECERLREACKAFNSASDFEIDSGEGRCWQLLRAALAPPAAAVSTNVYACGCSGSDDRCPMHGDYPAAAKEHTDA